MYVTQRYFSSCFIRGLREWLRIVCKKKKKFSIFLLRCLNVCCCWLTEPNTAMVTGFKGKLKSPTHSKQLFVADGVLDCATWIYKRISHTLKEINFCWWAVARIWCEIFKIWLKNWTLMITWSHSMKNIKSFTNFKADFQKLLKRL